jgi:hypothetical protein
MATIINDPYSKGRGGEAGEQIKNQIASGLTTIAQHKMAQITRHNQMQAYQNLGLPADISKSLSTLPPDQQKLILQNIGENQGFQSNGGADAQNQQQAGLGMGGAPGQGQPAQQNQQGQNQQQGQQQPQPWQILQQKPVGKLQKEVYAGARAQQNIIDKRLHPGIEKVQKAAHAFRKEEPTYNNLRKQIKSGELTPAWQVRLQNTLHKNGKYVLGGLGALGGAVLGGGAGSAAGGGAAGGVGAYIGAEKGKGLGEAAGALIPEFTGNEQDQAYKKGVMGFFKNVKDYFGSNIPLGEANIFLSTLPTLEMDNGAKLVVLDQMEAMGRLAEATEAAQNSIIREHGGHAPANLDELVQQRIQPQYEQTAQSITQSMDNLLQQSKKQTYTSGPKTWLPSL